MEFDYWLQIELAVFVGGIFSCIVYIFFRAIFLQKITLSVGGMLQGRTTDWLESQSILQGVMVTLCVPFFVLQLVDK